MRKEGIQVKIDGYKKFTVALLTLILIGLSEFFGKNLEIDINQTTEYIWGLVAVGFMFAQALHDIFKEKR
jgi:type IV secretory pathway VirB2 component (pilin)